MVQGSSVVGANTVAVDPVTPYAQLPPRQHILTTQDFVYSLFNLETTGLLKNQGQIIEVFFGKPRDNHMKVINSNLLDLHSYVNLQII